ncbi:MAG: type III-B CRISPR module RAMP protein Cmr1 [Desulfococcaceae bacterium]|jgi:CRISPR type III-B/RAMP module RAMP protein Cmr1|nr:type III-B CRISPR module RAMP protein Cmr1 [Desulfococcaceae bacterium]
MEITLQFLTPAFLYGTDRTRPEFRIPSLIGQMRYWWRMTQEWPENGNFKEFKEKEGGIFGIAGDDKSSAKPFFMYLKKKPDIKTHNPPSLLTKKDGTPQTDRATGEYLYEFPSKGNGVSYFFYPFKRHPGNFKWIPEDSQVKMEMECKPGTDNIPVLLSIFLLSRFGGLGGRSRRGAGAFELSGHPIFNLTENDLEKYIRSDQKETMPGHEFFSRIDSNSPLWQALSNKSRWKNTPQNGKDWSSALNPVGASMQNFRTRFRLLEGNDQGVDPDFVKEAKALHQYYGNRQQNQLPGHLTKDAFGLPRITNFSSGGFIPNAVSIAPYKNGEDKEGRRASPLHITVNRRGDNQYYCTLLILWDGLKFLPTNIPIRVKRSGNRNVNTYPVMQNPPVDKLEAFLKRI